MTQYRLRTLLIVLAIEVVSGISLGAVIYREYRHREFLEFAEEVFGNSGSRIRTIRPLMPPTGDKPV